MNKHSVIIVTPVYEDVEASSQLFKEIARQFQHTVFVVAVDDGSVKQPLKIESLNNEGIDGVVLKLKRNVGHQHAIAIGLGYVSEHIGKEQSVVVMDSDGEDLPSTIHDLLAQLQSDEVDVVVAQRKNRIESLRFKLFYAVYKRFFTLMTGHTISFGNFMAINYNAVRRLVSMHELSIHIAGAVIASKLRTKACPLNRGPRYAGNSKMNFVKLALHGFKGLTVFAEDVLVRVGIACAFIAGLSVLGGVIIIILKFLGVAMPGWTSIVLGIMILIFLQTGTLTLLTLMLTGLAGNISVTTVNSDLELIEAIEETDRNV